MKSKFTFTLLGNNWVKGLYKTHVYEAKIYSEPSAEFGIDKGHVSKLWISGLIEYDRGWNIGKTKTKIWKSLVKELDSLAQSETFTSTLNGVL